MRIAQLLIISALILQSCGGGGDDAPPPPLPLEIGSFKLLFPENNQLCTLGTDVSEGMISIPFRWNEAENATSYKLEIFEQGGTKTYEETVSTNAADVVITRGTQFNWKVTASLDQKELESDDIWNFYTEGTSVNSHVPFPAKITVTDNLDNSIDIIWEGSDLDDDIVSYDVSIGTESNPPALLLETTETSVLDYSIMYDTLYYLEIITLDTQGNRSISTKKFNFRS